MATLRVCLIVSICVLSISSVTAKCSFSQRLFQCNKASKAAFATAFSVAVAVTAVGCKTLTSSQWSRVGCHNPSSDRSTKICAPAKWSSVLKLFATAIALKKKILVKKPYTVFKLIYTSSGRELMRHELTHIRQQSGISSYKFGYRYITAYCDAGCSYSANRYVSLPFCVLGGMVRSNCIFSVTLGNEIITCNTIRFCNFLFRGISQLWGSGAELWKENLLISQSICFFKKFSTTVFNLWTNDVNSPNVTW